MLMATGQDEVGVFGELFDVLAVDAEC